MQECLSLDGNFGNPASRSHSFGWKAEEATEEARSNVASLVNCDPREIVWTSGATESDNLAIKGSARFNKSKGNHIITSKVEHKAVLDSCRQLEREGFEISYLDPNSNGIITPEMVVNSITDKTILVSLMHINNEIGVINNIKAYLTTELVLAIFLSITPTFTMKTCGFGLTNWTRFLIRVGVMARFKLNP